MPKARYYVKQPDHIRLFFLQKNIAAQQSGCDVGRRKNFARQALAGDGGDDTDAYVEEIVADTYAGMNRTDYGTNKLRADVKMEVGQWQKKSGSARAPPAGNKFSIIRVEGQKQDYGQGVLLDTNIFDGVKTRDWGSVLGKYVYENMAGAELTMYDENGDAETVYLARENDRVRKDGANRSHKVLDKLAGYRGDNVRAQAIVQLSEVLATSKQQETTDTHSHQWMDENGWIIRTAYLQNKNGAIYEATLNIADGRDRKILYEVNKVHQVDKTKIPGEHTATGESQHFRYQKTGAGGTQTEDGRTDAPRTFTAGVDGKNAADADSSKNSISKTGETVKGKMSAQDGRYRDLMGEKAAKYTKGILCAYRKIKKSLSKTGEGFLYRCTIIPITPFTKTMRSDKDTSGTPETIRTSDPSLRSRPDTTSGSGI